MTRAGRPERQPGDGITAREPGSGAALPAENVETSAIVETALVNLWSVVNDLSLIRPPGDRYRVAIFGSARTRPGDPLYEEVKQLACKLSKEGCDIVSGGGPGLMQAANEGARLGDPENKTTSYGVRIALPFEQSANPYIDTLFTHRTFFSRLHHFVRLSNAFIVVRGGIGTTLEALMIWQLLQVRQVDDVPLVFVGPMWRHLVAWADEHMRATEPPMADPRDMAIPTCVDTADEALAAVDAHHAAFLARHPGAPRPESVSANDAAGEPSAGPRPA